MKTEDKLLMAIARYNNCITTQSEFRQEVFKILDGELKV